MSSMTLSAFFKASSKFDFVAALAAVAAQTFSLLVVLVSCRKTIPRNSLIPNGDVPIDDGWSKQLGDDLQTLFRELDSRKNFLDRWTWLELWWTTWIERTSTWLNPWWILTSILAHRSRGTKPDPFRDATDKSSALLSSIAPPENKPQNSIWRLSELL